MSNRIGVLALQGDFLEHQAALLKIGVNSSEIRLPEQLDTLDGIIIPGGESTTISKLMDIYDIRQKLKHCINNGLAVWGTCAGMILLAKSLEEPDPIPLQVMNIKVSRNAYGRQRDSFETKVKVTQLGSDPYHAIFIRAPKITDVGNNVEILASLKDGGPIAVREKNLLATSFHPELTNDLRFHSFFMSIVNSHS